MLRRRELLRWSTLVLIIACPLSLWGSDSEMQEPKTPIARLEVQPARIDWLPHVDYESLVLTVAGPGEFYIQRKFDAGESPTFSSLDGPDGNLPDGIYAYELRAIPRTPVVKELQKELGPSDRPLVQSGHLWIQGGSFVNKAPVKPNPSRQGESASKPPSNVTANTTIPDDLIVEGHACIGSECVDATGPALKIKEPLNYTIQFDGLGAFFPYERRWALQANDPPGNNGDFLFRDLSFNTIPFRIGSEVPDNALTISTHYGNIGMGTLTPAVRLDVRASDAGKATERLHNSSATGYSGTEYLDNAGNVDLFFGVDNAASTTRLNSVNNNPIVVLTNSTERLRVTSGGDVGIGTTSPAGALDVTRSTGALATLARFSNNKGIQVLYDRTDAGSTDWQTSNFGDFQISVPGSIPGQFSLLPNGNLTISGTLTQGSSRDLKTDLTSLNPKDILARVSTLPVSLWSYKTEAAIHHVGPMAEDFHEAFGLGADDKHIAPGDTAGVALLAVQGLNQILQSKAEEIYTLQRENADLTKRVEALEALLSTAMDKKDTLAQSRPPHTEEN
jgi:Chaperone of endosialidase